MNAFAKFRASRKRTSVEEKTGLWLLCHKDLEEEGCVDIFAVHGLGGDKFGTWTENGCLWLRDLLPKYLPEARIFTYGYDSVVAFSKSSANVDDFARDLLHQIHRHRNSEAERARPIVFVCHSLGGILFKQALSIAHNDWSYQSLLDSFTGVVFMGTPHGGSDIAYWTTFGARLLHALSLGTRTNKDLIAALSKDSTSLNLLSKEFAVQSQALRILSFYETEKFPLLNCRIVEKDSAQLTLPNETLLPIRADHRAMCRFSDGQGQKFQSVKDAVVALVRNEGESSLEWRSLSSRYKESLNTWLNPVAATDDLNRNKSNRLWESCEWIRQEPRFKQWMGGDYNTLLWLIGPPGCGKSTIATRIIEDLQARATVGFFFCSFSDTNRQNLLDVLRTWTWQILQQRQYLTDHVFRIYAETVGATTPLDSYQRALKCLLANGGPCYLLIDGLDECSASFFLPLRRSFEELLNHARILVLSRRDAWIESSLSPKSLISKLEITPEHTSNDIERFVLGEVEKLQCEEKESWFITHRVLEGSKGMFLWAQLMTKHLLQQATIKDILSALEDLPYGIEKLYERLLQRFQSLPQAHFKVAQRVLQWTFSATRPLSIPELERALEVVPGSTQHDHGNKLPSLRKFVRDSCGPLLEVDSDNDIVRFVHASALEFLKQVDTHSLQYLGNQFLIFTPKTRNEYVTAVCLTYLSYEEHGFVEYDYGSTEYDNNLRNHLQQRPFLEYCALNWWKHLPNESSTSDLHQSQLSESIKIFVSTQAAIVRWIQLFQLLSAGTDPQNRDPTLFQLNEPLYVQLYNSSTSYFSHIGDAPSGLFSRWHRWTTEVTFHGRQRISTPIRIASFFDLVQVIASEQSRGKGLDVPDARGFTPLMLAAHGEAPNAVKMLLEAGADVQKTTVIGYGVARYASRNAIAVISTLLGAGADLSTCDGNDGRNPVQAACSVPSIHPNILSELLKYASCEELNMKDFIGRNVLHLAAAINVKFYADLFMERLSSTANKSKMPQQLRTTIEDVFAPMTTSAIQTWAESWGFKISTFLIGSNSRRDLLQDVTALIRGIKLIIIDSICQRGVQMNEIDDTGRTALHLAIETEYEVQPTNSKTTELDQVVAKLLQYGSRVEITDSLGRLPIDIATARRNWSAVASLTARNASHRFTEPLAISQPIRFKRELNTHLGVESQGSSCTYHPNRHLDVQDVASCLQQCFERCSERLRNTQTYTSIIESILNYAAYWTRSCDAINPVDYTSGSSEDGRLSVEVAIGGCKIRKVEVYVYVRDVATSRTHRDSGDGVDCPPWARSHTRSSIRRMQSRDRHVKEVSILDMTWRRRGKYLRQNQERTIPIPQGGWTRIEGSVQHVWRQTWLTDEYDKLQNDRKIALAHGESPVVVVNSLIRLLEEGDRILVKPSPNFFVQDIALYSGFSLAVYYAWDLKYLT